MKFVVYREKVDIKFGKTLPGAKAPITVTAESNIGGKHMFDTNQTARPEVNRTNTPTLAAGNAKIDPSNPNLTMKNAHAEIALIQRAYDAGLTKGETMQVLVRGIQRLIGFGKKEEFKEILAILRRQNPDRIRVL